MPRDSAPRTEAGKRLLAILREMHPPKDGNGIDWHGRIERIEAEAAQGPEYTTEFLPPTQFEVTAAQEADRDAEELRPRPIPTTAPAPEGLARFRQRVLDIDNTQPEHRGRWTNTDVQDALAALTLAARQDEPSPALPEAAQEAPAPDLSGHRINEPHDCFAMNCRGLAHDLDAEFETMWAFATRWNDMADLVRLMDSKATAHVEDPDGTVESYIVPASALNRVLAFANGSKSQATKRALDKFRRAAVSEEGSR